MFEVLPFKCYVMQLEIYGSALISDYKDVRSNVISTSIWCPIYRGKNVKNIALD